MFSPIAPLAAKSIVIGVLATTLGDPGKGLVVTVVLAPLGALLADLVGAGGFRLSEAIVLAFLAGWMIRGGAAVPTALSLPPQVSRAGWLLAAFVLASVAGIGWQLTGSAKSLLAALSPLSGPDFYTISDPLGMIESAKLVEGLALAGATVALIGRAPRLARGVPAALAAVTIIAVVVGALLSLGFGSPAMLKTYARTGYRVGVPVGDENAAGSYFVLVLCLAIGMAVRVRRSGRAFWLAVTAACFVGLWLSGSRSAFAAGSIVIPLATCWAASLRWRSKARVALLAAVVALIGGASMLGLLHLERDPSYTGKGFREQFVTTSTRMIAARPLLGVGAGRYYQESSLFLTPQLAWTYGAENAHNYFLQVTGELGLLGFGLFAVFVVGSLLVPIRALRYASDDFRLLGAVAGLLGFLLTCLTGHPLLVREVAFPFWLQLGLVIALGTSTLLDAERGAVRSRTAAPLLRGATAIVAALIILSVPIRALRLPAPPATANGADGFYGWEIGDEGRRFRWTSRYSSLFVPADAMTVEIPVRVVESRFGPRFVEVRSGGLELGTFPVSDHWRTISVPLPAAAAFARYKRLDLGVERTWRPALVIPGNAELREVGVQVGEVRLGTP
jgi:O-antigen ligase